MVIVFSGADAATHDAFQSWRRAHTNGFNLTESSRGVFTAHWAEDCRDHGAGRGCMHQGGSSLPYKADGVICLTNKTKVCADGLAELLDWASSQSARVKYCKHCDSGAHPISSFASRAPASVA